MDKDETLPRMGAEMTQEEIDALATTLRNQGLTWNQTNFAVAVIRDYVEPLRQQLADSQKQATLLRGMIAIAALHVRPTCMKLYDDLTEALAATADIDGLILCDAVEVGWIGTGPRDRRCEFSESKPANSVMRDFNIHSTAHGSRNET